MVWQDERSESKSWAKSGDDLSLFWQKKSIYLSLYIYTVIYYNIYIYQKYIFKNGDVIPVIDKRVSNVKIAEFDQNGSGVMPCSLFISRSCFWNRHGH